MKRRKGFTLIEMIIVMMLTIVVLAMIFAIFFAGNRVFSEADVKSTFQMEGQDLQEELTKKNMQGIGVKKVIKTDNDMLEDDSLEEWCNEKQSTNVSEIWINYADAEKESGEYQYTNQIYQFKLVPTDKTVKDGDEEVIVNDLVMIDESGKEKTLSTNVRDFVVIPDKNNSVTLNISLLKHCWTGNQKYNVNFDISFRNRNSTLDNSDVDDNDEEEEESEGEDGEND
ncbi:PilW family protein [uncultured Clostridium sp.]|uniref:PilW family protein n=1 Tax=uncultured Clostridium sp. TaxID=59620 RepID=UPI0025F10A5F|nr:prepilin-type N-terminal cleavage/methylation domain-containing protein [uncultured Clostridium sp.]